MRGDERRWEGIRGEGMGLVDRGRDGGEVRREEWGRDERG